MSLSIDWSRLEEVVERAVRRARSEELREMAEAIKTLADFMKTGFKEMLDRIDRVEKWVYNDVEGFVHGVPSIIEVDVVIRDKEYILLEVKSRVGRGDVYELSKVGKLYERVTGVKPRLAILAGFMDRGVKELAEKLGVEVMPIAASFST